MKRKSLIPYIIILAVLMLGAVSCVPQQSSSSSTTSVLATVNEKLSSLTTKVANLEASMEKKASTSSVNDLQSTINSLQNRINNLPSSSASTDEINSLKSKVSSLEAKIIALEAWKTTYETSGSTGSGSSGDVTVTLLPNYQNVLIVADNSTTHTFLMEVKNNTSSLQWVKVDVDITPRDGAAKTVTPAGTLVQRTDTGTAQTLTMVCSPNADGSSCTDISGRTQSFTVQKGQSYTIIITVKLSASSTIWQASFDARYKDYSW